MSTQNAILVGSQCVSDSGQERGPSLQEQVTGKRIDEIRTQESPSPVNILHHSTCCCMSCWPKNINSYL